MSLIVNLIYWFNALEKYEILPNKNEIRLLFQLISTIADNHHRTSNFFNNWDKIFQNLINDNPSPISYFIADYKNYNIPILFLFSDKGLIIPDESFLNDYFRNKPSNRCYYNESFKETQINYFIYPKIKEFIDKQMKKQIE